jgi:spore maturation protein CgeB
MNSKYGEATGRSCCRWRLICNAARIDTETCVRIFNSSKINLNLHSSTHQEDVVADGDFVNPRTFEIACCGAFQLVDRRNLLAELFADGEMETFSDIAELREKIDYYLKNANDRMVYSEKARKRVLQEHTYRKRMEELVTIMVSSFPHLAEKHQRRLDQRSSVLDDLDSHEGLAELMERLQPGTWFTLEDIYRNISTSGAELSRAEKIFVALSHVETVREAPPQ